MGDKGPKNKEKKKKQSGKRDLKKDKAKTIPTVVDAAGKLPRVESNRS